MELPGTSNSSKAPTTYLIKLCLLRSTKRWPRLSLTILAIQTLVYQTSHNMHPHQFIAPFAGNPNTKQPHTYFSIQLFFSEGAPTHISRQKMKGESRTVLLAKSSSTFIRTKTGWLHATHDFCPDSRSAHL